MSEPRAFATSFAAENAGTAGRNTAAKQELLFSAFSGEVIGAFRMVHWRLGFGFVESVYANALELEFRKRCIPYEREVPVTVMYDDVPVGNFRADFITHGRILLELKSVEALQPIHGVQTLNYLRSTGIELALLLNFGPKPTLRRFICSSQGSETHL
jgi:GxxExxY protein